MDDSSYMITASLKNKVAVTKLDDDAHVHLYHVFQADLSTGISLTTYLVHIDISIGFLNFVEMKLKTYGFADSRAHIHLLATSSCNTFLAVGDISNRVNVYDLKKCSVSIALSTFCSGYLTFF